MDGEDEEVIFENRALHQALSEMGVEYVETEKVVANEFQELYDSTDGEVTKVQDNAKNHRIPIDFLPRTLLSQQEITSIYQSFQRNTLNRLKISPLLSSDDKCFLASFISDETSSDQKSSKRPFLQSIFKYCGLFAVVLGMFYIFITSFFMVIDQRHVPELPHTLEMESLYFVTISLTLVGVLIYGLLKFHFYHKVYSKLKEMDCIIKEFEESAEILSRIQRKCVRRIRESEVAARGFTFTSLTSNSNSNSPLMTQVDKWCPSFRAALFNGNLDVAGHLEKSYKLLAESIPLVVDFKWLDIKPSQLSASSSSSGLNKGNNSSTSDGDNEEIVPTAQLSSSQELLTIYISAFVRRLVLSFVSDNRKDSEINPYIAISQSVQSCLESMNAVTSILNKHYSFYRAIHMSTEKPESTDDQKDNQRMKTHLESFYIFVNSLDLHLQTVFKMTRDLTGHLEGKIEEERLTRDRLSSSSDKDKKDIIMETLSEKDRDQWMENLKGIKSELDSCKSCYDEAVKFLSQRESKASPNTPTRLDSSPKATLSSHTDSTPKPQIIIPDSDPVIEDQVFEAVIESDGDEVKSSRKRTYTPEEKAQIRQQKEDLSKFKQELKAVVDHRAIHQRKREERAVARAQGKTESSSTPSETDVSSVGGGEGDDEGDSGSSSTESQNEKKVNDKSQKSSELHSSQVASKGEVVCGASNKFNNEKIQENSELQSSQVDSKEEVLCEASHKLINDKSPKSFEPKSLQVASKEVFCETSNTLINDKTQSTFEPQLPQKKEELFCETSVKSENETSLTNLGSRHEYTGEKVSLLAAKLDSADSDENCINPSELPWAPLRRKGNAEVTGFQPDKGQNGSGHSSSLSQQLPYDENWRSSIEKSKARHWEMCERIIQENKGTGSGDGDIKTLDSATDPAGNLYSAIGNDLDNSSFVDISSEELLFYPIDTDTNSNANNNNNDNCCHVDAAAIVRQHDSDKASSSCSSNSQVVCPKSINPEDEGFRNVQGAYVSRHNFTASGKGTVLEKALKEIRKQDEAVNDDDDDDEEEKVLHPKRKRHQAGGELNSSQWVNISHVEFVSCNGNQYELFRQKDITSNDITTRSPIPSPDPSSSLNASLALMAAARSKHFNLGVEEHFINDDDDVGVEDEFCQAICAARMNDTVGSNVTAK